MAASKSDKVYVEKCIENPRRLQDLISLGSSVRTIEMIENTLVDKFFASSTPLVLEELVSRLKERVYDFVESDLQQQDVPRDFSRIDTAIGELTKTIHGSLSYARALEIVASNVQCNYTGRVEKLRILMELRKDLICWFADYAFKRVKRSTLSGLVISGILPLNMALGDKYSREDVENEYIGYYKAKLRDIHAARFEKPKALEIKDPSEVEIANAMVTIFGILNDQRW